MLSLADTHILGLVQYVPGRPIKETQIEYGIETLIKLASNENPWGPSPKALAEIQNSLTQGHLYPNSERLELKQQICHYHAPRPLQINNIVLGNGANELIMLLVRAFIGQGQQLLNAWPSFIVYRLAANAVNREETTVALTPSLDYDLGALLRATHQPHNSIKMVFIANPNNPTGKYLSKKDLDTFLDQLPPQVIAVVDEAYAEFVCKDDFSDSINWVVRRPRTVVLRTFSKIFGLAGFRIGYAICDPHIAEVLHRVRDPFNVNSIALAAARGALKDDEHKNKTKIHNAAELVRVSAQLSSMGVVVTPSAANFLLMHLPQGCRPASQVISELIRHGLIVRPLETYGMPNAVRVTMGLRQENDQFLRALAAII